MARTISVGRDLGMPAQLGARGDNGESTVPRTGLPTAPTDMGRRVDARWNLATAKYARKSYTPTQEATPQGVAFNDEGTIMYVVGPTADTVFQYTLSSPKDVSTASYATKFKLVSAQDTAPISVAFNDDGTIMYILGSTNNTVFQYTLSTAWDVATATYATKLKSVASEDTAPLSIFFGNEGTKMYVVGSTGNAIFQYTLATAWDVATAVYDTKSFDPTTQDATPQSVFFDGTGKKMFIVGNTTGTVYQYSLLTAWDVSTAYFAKKKKAADQDSDWGSIFFDSTGTKMYLVGRTADSVHQFILVA